MYDDYGSIIGNAVKIYAIALAGLGEEPDPSDRRLIKRWLWPDFLSGAPAGNGDLAKKLHNTVIKHNSRSTITSIST